MQVQFQLEGAEHLHRGLLELAELYEKGAHRVLKFGLRKAGRVVAEESKRRLDSVTRGGTGETRDSIGVGVAPKRDMEDADAAVVVGASKDRDYIARFLEFGTSKMSAREHAGPAFDVSAQEALSVFVRQTSKALKRAARKMARRAPR